MHQLKVLHKIELLRVSVRLSSSSFKFKGLRTRPNWAARDQHTEPSAAPCWLITQHLIIIPMLSLFSFQKITAGEMKLSH